MTLTFDLEVTSKFVLELWLSPEGCLKCAEMVMKNEKFAEKFKSGKIFKKVDLQTQWGLPTQITPLHNEPENFGVRI